MLQQKTGVGVIGCGTISDVYLTNIKEHYHNLEVIACADMYPEKAEQTKEKYMDLLEMGKEETMQ